MTLDRRQATTTTVGAAARVTPSAPHRGPLFSVVVPVFDPVAEHLIACIRSVRAQSYPNWELVLVDVSGGPARPSHLRAFCRIGRPRPYRATATTQALPRTRTSA